jgi:rhamnogalacturonan endolyase
MAVKKHKKYVSRFTQTIPYGVLLLCLVFGSTDSAQRKMEYLGRGVVAQNTGNGNVYISWRYLGTDPENIAFNIYRVTDGGSAKKLNDKLITTTTDYSDQGVDMTKSNAWYVRPVVGGVEWAPSTSFTLPANAAVKKYIALPLQPLSGYYTIHVYVGDLDGDGEYDYIVKRMPDTYAKNVYLEAYLNDGTYKWRVDLGPNTEQGNAAANPFLLVYDFDSDGKAEVFTRTSEGTVFADGMKIGDVNKDGVTDYRTFPPVSSLGYMLLGDNCPEYVSMVDGMTGKEITRTNYLARGAKAQWTALWGDSYGHRMNFNFVGVAYLDGVNPSIIASRGEGSLMDIIAWDYKNKSFSTRWTWSSKGKTFSSGQHWADFHNIRVVDLDGDGKDEVSWGVNAMDDNGSPLYLAPSDLGHGDRFGIGDFDPDRAGLEAFVIQQRAKSTNIVELAALYDAKTGTRIKTFKGPSCDVARGDVADIDPRYKGMEYFSYASRNLLNCKGDSIAPAIPHPALSIWWDGDLLRELLDAADKNGYSPIINKWNYTTSTSGRLLSLYNEGGQYSTRTIYAGRPPLYADIMGDWREEIICENSNRTELRIFTTPIPATRRIYTLMHNPAYRLCINLKYYLPTPYPDFYLGEGMETPPMPNITTVGGKTPVVTTSSVAHTPIVQLLYGAYRLNKESDVVLRLFDLNGRCITSRFISGQSRGVYNISGIVQPYSHGSYLLEIKTTESSDVVKIQHVF